MRTRIPVAELLRVSTQEQGKADRAGIPRQIELNKKTIERHDLELIKTFKLVDVSGTSILHTPELSELLHLVKTHRIRGIVVADFDRLMRPDDFRSLAILQDIKESQTLLYLPEQVIDLNTQSGFLMSGLQSVIAGNELAQIKKRMVGAKEEKRRQGKCPSTKFTLPLGVDYDRQTEKFYYTENAGKVKELFRLFHDKKIHNLKELERQTGIQHRTISNLLRNELYIGYRHYTEKRSPQGRYKPDGRRNDSIKIKRLPQETIRVKVIDSPLISEEVFQAAQHILNSKKHEYTQRRIKSKNLFLFSGHLKCGVCGEPMYTVPGGKQGTVKDYYYCRRKAHHFKSRGCESCPSSYLRRTLVENKLLEFISTHLSEPGYILEQLQSLHDKQGQDDHHKKKRDIQQRIAELQKKKAKILDLYLKGIYSEEEISGKAQEVQKEIDQAQEALKNLEDQSENFRPEDYRKDIEQIATAFCDFQFLTPTEQRTFLAVLKPSFFISPEGITDFMLPVCKNGNHMGADSTLADQKNGIKYLSFGIKTPYPFFQKPTLESLGLKKKPFYSPAEIAKALGDHKDVLRKRILAGIYPEAKTKLGNGQRRFTPKEVLIMATIKEKIKAGIRVHS